MLADFLTAFQFLTRIHIVQQTQWSQESFGRGVKFFPIVGGIIGMILAAFVYAFQTYTGGKLAPHLLALAILLLEILITGGLHYDGLMDTMDGIFSGRSRERMLEIMKDSRVGSFGVMGFCLVILLKYSLWLDMAQDILFVACLTAPIVGRTAVVMAILLFPYARQEGLGVFYQQHSESYALYAAFLFTCIMLSPLGGKAWLCGLGGIVFAFSFACYVKGKLGGLTGDVYGAVAELTQAVVLLLFILL